jgi:single-stranded-DNA-specific exonuclease
MAAKRWIVRQQDSSRAAALAVKLGVSPIVAGLLIARGCEEAPAAERFLKPSPDQLHDPFLMLGMSDAVTRLLRAIDGNERILVYGDYDVDGTDARGNCRLSCAASFYRGLRYPTEGPGDRVSQRIQAGRQR